MKRHDKTSWWASVLRDTIKVHESNIKHRQKAYDRLKDKATIQAQKALAAIEAEKLLLVKHQQELDAMPEKAKEK